MRTLCPSFALALFASIAPLASALGEQGEDDFLISTGPALAANHTAPAVASAPEAGTYLVVWRLVTTVLGGEHELLMARLYDAQTRGPVGEPFEIATLLDSESHDVAYSSAQEEYTVVWTEGSWIYSRRIDASTGGLGSTAALYASIQPGKRPEELSIAYGSSARDSFLVAWHQPLSIPFANGEEVHGLLIDASDGSPLSPPQPYSSDESLDVDSRSMLPDIAYNDTKGEFLIVWQSNRLGGGLEGGKWKHWGRRVDEGTGEPLDESDVRLEDPDQPSGAHELEPQVAYSPLDDTFLVAYGRSWSKSGPPDAIHLRLFTGDGLEHEESIASILALDDSIDALAAVADTRHGGFRLAWSQGDPTAQVLTRPISWKPKGDSGGPIETISDLAGPGARDVTLAFHAGVVEFLVVWSAEGTLQGPGSRIFGQFWTAYPTEVEATETVRTSSLGSIVGFAPGVTTGPVLGKTWDPKIQGASSGVLASVLQIGFAATEVLVPGIQGAVLCAASELPLVLADSSGGFEVPIPGDQALIGLPVCTQAFIISATQIEAQNAIDLVVGTY